MITPPFILSLKLLLIMFVMHHLKSFVSLKAMILFFEMFRHALNTICTCSSIVNCLVLMY